MFKFVAIFFLYILLAGCSYTQSPGVVQSGSAVGGTGDKGFSHEPLGGGKHIATVTAAPGVMETESSIAQRIHIFANKFAAKTCPVSFDFVHDPNFDQIIAGGVHEADKNVRVRVQGLKLSLSNRLPATGVPLCPAIDSQTALLRVQPIC